MRRMRGLILVVALVFAACGGDDPTEPIHGMIRLIMVIRLPPMGMTPRMTPRM